MLSKRPEISALISGFMLGISALVISSPNIVIAISMACACALLCLTATSEKKVFIFLAGGVSVAFIGFTFIAVNSLVEQLAITAAILALTFYISEILSK